ncbi:MAG: hypothetical protein AUK59_06675 [Candidatus Altarchaeum sp. CG2_30_32_3053]|nr:MAG: hypothetical protein AUK59_06675 [Candidatus Altarchaeum sp. CG2_30_32_3053]
MGLYDVAPHISGKNNCFFDYLNNYLIRAKLLINLASLVNDKNTILWTDTNNRIINDNKF